MKSGMGSWHGKNIQRFEGKEIHRKKRYCVTSEQDTDQMHEMH